MDLEAGTDGGNETTETLVSRTHRPIPSTCDTLVLLRYKNPFA